jgi:hypothetical protein
LLKIKNAGVKLIFKDYVSMLYPESDDPTPYERFTFEYWIGTQLIYSSRYELCDWNFQPLKEKLEEYINNGHKGFEMEFLEPDFYFNFEPVEFNTEKTRFILTIDSYGFPGVNDGYSSQGLSALLYFDDGDLKQIVNDLDNFIKERGIEKYKER